MLAPIEKVTKQPWYYTRTGWLELVVFAVVFAVVVWALS